MQTFLVADKPNILVLTRGHPFDRNAYFGMLEGIRAFEWTHAEHPAAQLLIASGAAERFDGFLFYDMPGLDFLSGNPRPRYVEPIAGFKEGLLKLMDMGKGFVFTHHAIAGWPSWPEYAEILGGRFLYRPDSLRGRARPDSGYRHNVPHTVRTLKDHPITRGITSFAITDELYLFEVFDDAIEPLLASDYAFVRDNFYSATLAIAGKMYANDGWSHDPGLPLIGWAKSYRSSPIAYLQCGDGPEAYAAPAIKTLIEQAVGWTLTGEARAWARERRGKPGTG